MNLSNSFVTDHLKFIAPIFELKKELALLQPKASLVGHLSIDGDVALRYPLDELNDYVDKLGQCMSKYGHWSESKLTVADSPNEATEMAEFVIKTIEEITENKNPNPSSDPRDYFDIAKLNEVINKIMSIMITVDDFPNPFLPTNGGFIGLFSSVNTFIMLGVVNILNSLACAFGLKTIETMEYHQTSIEPGKNPLGITYHDEVVSFSKEEKLAMEQEAAQKAAELARKQELEEKKAATAEFASTILKCYNRHMQVGNLTNITLSDEALRCLNNPESDEDIFNVESLYTLLLAMSNSVRYMPGENGSTIDRIMGSFMELDKDIASYKQPFTIYLGEFGLKHNDIVAALPLIKAVGGRIVAQYVDSKMYIDKPVDDQTNGGPRLVHLLFTP